jgi:hypothetical protein
MRNTQKQVEREVRHPRRVVALAAEINRGERDRGVGQDEEHAQQAEREVR